MLAIAVPHGSDRLSNAAGAVLTLSGVVIAWNSDRKAKASESAIVPTRKAEGDSTISVYNPSTVVPGRLGAFFSSMAGHNIACPTWSGCDRKAWAGSCTAAYNSIASCGDTQNCSQVRSYGEVGAAKVRFMDSTTSSFRAAFKAGTAAAAVNVLTGMNRPCGVVTHRMRFILPTAFPAFQGIDRWSN